MSHAPGSDPLDHEIDFTDARRGAVIPEPRKQRMTIYLDQDVLHHFRQRVLTLGKGSYQGLINEALQEHIARERDGERYKEARLKQILAEVLAEREAA